jgi:hypothetical protein
LKIHATLREIMDAGIWDEFCEESGTNPWCLNEGADEDAVVVIPAELAVKMAKMAAAAAEKSHKLIAKPILVPNSDRPMQSSGRFLLFEIYDYPSGGQGDHERCFATMDELLDYVNTNFYGDRCEVLDRESGDWFHVVSE